jgi:hypothetical protein
MIEDSLKQNSDTPNEYSQSSPTKITDAEAERLAEERYRSCIRRLVAINEALAHGNYAEWHIAEYGYPPRRDRNSAKSLANYERSRRKLW